MNTKRINSSSNETGAKSSFSTNLILIAVLCAMWLVGTHQAHGAGTLKPAGASDLALEIRDHRVSVIINNGFARTEVEQVFYNPNAHTTEGFYTFPVPKEASLADVVIISGDVILEGEVVEKKKAEQIYEEETSNGNQAGLTQKDEYRDFEFWVAPIYANSEVTLRFTYYQPLEIDLGIGRYVYPLEEGNTDEAAEQFWSRNDKVSGEFSINVEIKSAWPVVDLRSPGFSGNSSVTESGMEFSYASKTASLNTDFVMYYRLADNLPGRVEVIPYKESKDKPGTFMMVVTPGVDLKPLTGGTDYVFVLDVSGSMREKIGTLVAGVKKTIRSFIPQDRFRIVLFSDKVTELTKDWTPASEEQVAHAMKILDNVQSGGGTDVYAGLKRAFRGMDNDRVTNMILVTDGVTNSGIVDLSQFEKLMRQKDMRFFGFLLGNQSNWPLMETICNASGGYYKSISNSDDIIGQIMLAKSKVRFEAMHDFNMTIRGVDTFSVSPSEVRKVFRGQQLVFLGRYAEGGKAEVTFKTRISGEDKVYTTTFDFPDVDTKNPELERIWALERIEKLELDKALGRLNESESETAIIDLALEYQLVTDYTSMIVLTDEGFARHGIKANNRERMAREVSAQKQRMQNPVTNRRVDKAQPAFKQTAPRSSGGGGGAISPWMALLLVGVMGFVGRRTFKK